MSIVSNFDRTDLRFLLSFGRLQAAAVLMQRTDKQQFNDISRSKFHSAYQVKSLKMFVTRVYLVYLIFFLFHLNQTSQQFDGNAQQKKQLFVLANELCK